MCTTMHRLDVNVLLIPECRVYVYVKGSHARDGGGGGVGERVLE